MSEFEPTRPEGAEFHECENCGGTGVIEDPDTGDEYECPDCDGTGEWFE